MSGRCRVSATGTETVDGSEEPTYGDLASLVPKNTACGRPDGLKSTLAESCDAGERVLPCQERLHLFEIPTYLHKGATAMTSDEPHSDPTPVAGSEYSSPGS